MRIYLLFVTGIYGIYRDAPTKRGMRLCYGAFSTREKATDYATREGFIDSLSMDVEIIETIVDPPNYTEI
jgi:hypothetical protein